MSQPMGGRGPGTRQQEIERLRERYDWLTSFTDDELGEIVFLEEGEPMSSDDLYLDISNPERGAHHAQDGEPALEGSRYVPKSRVPQALWEKLVRPYR